MLCQPDAYLLIEKREKERGKEKKERGREKERKKERERQKRTKERSTVCFKLLILSKGEKNVAS